MSLYRRGRPLFNLIGLVLLVALIIYFRIDLRQTLAFLVRANGWDVALAVLLFVPFLFAKAWRWQVILRDLELPLPFAQSLRLYALGLGAGMVTPGQVGDAVKAAYFRNRGLGRALLSVVLDRLWDVLVLLLLAGAGAFLFWREFEGEWIALALLIAGCGVALAATASARVQVWLFAQLARLRRSADGQAAFEPVRLSGMQILRQFGLTALATAVVYLRLYLLVAALDVRLDVIPFVAAMSLASVAALLPVSISGVGTRDAALLLVAPVLGIRSEQALGISALILFLSIINGLVGFGVWLNWKLEDRPGTLEVSKTSKV